MCSVLSEVCSVLSEVCSVLSAVCSVLSAMCSLNCAFRSVLSAMCSGLQNAVRSVKYTLCNVVWTLLCGKIMHSNRGVLDHVLLCKEDYIYDDVNFLEGLK